MAPRKRKKQAPSLSQLDHQKQVLENQLKLLKASSLTDSMLNSFQSMAQALLCPLCGQVIEHPQTLAACAHSFCVSCIDDYTCNNWQCPGKFPLQPSSDPMGCGLTSSGFWSIAFSTNETCAVPGCGQSIALRGNRRGKFRRTNPSLETIATSWKSIHKALTRAPPEWWKEEQSETKGM